MSKVAICGTSPTLRQAYLLDDSWNIWFLNHTYELAPQRITKHFDLHSTQNYNNDHPYFRYLKENEIKLILSKPDSRLLKAKLYPKDEIMAKYGDYFTCSMSWMIALAIEMGYNTIGLYGIDCSTTYEFVKQKPSVLYFLGIAKAKGINLVFPEGCQLFKKDKLYGEWS